MAAVLKTKGFAFQQLTTTAQNEAIRRVGEINVEGEDYAHWTLEGWNNLLTAFNFFNVEIYYSGFWSQGDGASFEGKWEWNERCGEALLLLANGEEGEVRQGFAQRLVTLVAEARLSGIELPKMILKYERYRHYSHENSVSIEFEGTVDECDVEDHTYDDRLDEWCRDMMKQIYRDLEAEYNYQSSDRDAIIETIEANDWRFDESGCML